MGGINEDYIHKIKLDNHNNIYLMGNTRSADFPMRNAFDSTLGGFSGYFLKIVEFQENCHESKLI